MNVNILPKTGEIALWPNTRVVKCTFMFAQTPNDYNNKNYWYNFLDTFCIVIQREPTVDS